MTPNTDTSIGWWQGRLLRRANGVDRFFVALLTLLAIVVVVVGHQARLVLRPRAAIQNARILDDLELPTRLPNAVVIDASGRRAPIFDTLKTSRAAVAFYAPWCGPCQKELPILTRLLSPHVDVLIVVSADEDLEATRRQLANLGLGDRGFAVDETHQLEREGRVTALPTTFVVTRQGAVLERTRGYSMTALFRLQQRVAPNDRAFAVPEAE